MIKTISILIIITISLLAGGCASGTKRETTSPEASYILSQTQKVGAIDIILTPDAKKQVIENLKFDAEELKKHVHRALEASEFIDESSKDTLASLTVEVTDIRIRTNFTAVMFGFMAGADSIKGNIILRDPAGNELDRFLVSVSYALGGFAGGQDTARVSWLYEKFAEEALKELNGNKKK